jgi:hypothetical protein
MNTKLYTGNGGTQSITGVGFQPDWTWIKGRSNASYHRLTDAVRGVTKEIYSNDPAAEATNANGLTTFGTDGFSLGDSGDYNSNGWTFASWNWKANGAGSANTAGSINSTVSANTTAGFSIVKYTGNATVSTIGHGLGVAPKMIITKNLSRSDAFPVDCRQLGGTMYLNETGTLQSYADSSPYPSTAPTNLVYSVGTAGNANYSGSNLIAYCFAEKTGYSKFGSYTGNGNADGSFIYTGFKPAFVIVKCSSHAGESWWIGDNKRPGYNVNQKALLAESSAAESDESYQAVDFLSNGIKWRGTNDRVNASGKTYIYMAFAEAPLVGSNNIPCTAR